MVGLLQRLDRAGIDDGTMLSVILRCFTLFLSSLTLKGWLEEGAGGP